MQHKQEQYNKRKECVDKSDQGAKSDCGETEEGEVKTEPTRDLDEGGL